MPPCETIPWKFVEREGKQWRCPYCKKKFSGGVNRVRNHLLKIEGQQISICKKAPDCIGELMKWLLDQVPYPKKEDIAWKFVERLGGDKWRCHHCKEESFGDATAVERHLLGGSNEGISICREVPAPIRELMRSLLEEATEEESGEANGRSSTEPQSGDLQRDAQAGEAEEDSREVNGQCSMEPQSRQFFTEPRLSDWTSLFTPGLNSGQQSQSQAECQFHQRSTMPSTVQNSHGEVMSYSREEECYVRNSPYHEERQMNDQQTPAGELSSQCEQSRAVGNSNCLQDCNRHPQLQAPMDIDSSIALQHASDFRYIEETAVDLQASEATTIAIGPSSSQAPALMNAVPSIPFSSQVQNDAPLPPHIPSSSLDMNRNKIRNLKRKMECLEDKEADVKEQMEIESTASSVRKKPRILVERWLKKTERVRNNFQIIGLANAETSPTKEQVETLTREVEELIEQKLPQPMLIEAQDTKGVPFLVRKLTSAAIHRNIELIWDLLKKNHACKLGIYGMGGVGKTTIMMHLYNKLVKDATFDGVGFVTVSQDFSIYKLQSDIWKALKFGAMEDKHEKERAAMLSEKLESKKNCVLILDDVWKRLDLEEVGIPVTAGGFKLALTTRSVEVCRQMQCQVNIKIEPLSQEEAESLFLEELGSEVALSLEIEAVAKSIVEECAGLPLGVITTARSMRGVTQLFKWKDFLVKLKESSVGQTDMKNQVLKILEFSYDCLGDHQKQQCFLSCALYPEDESIGKLELIELFIDQGLIEELDTREQQYNRGLTILSDLKNVCLLEDHRSRMKMHDLIRDMALDIIGATSMVKAGKQLTRIPSEECWKDALERVSLMKNYFGELDMSPNCPKLSVLLLNNSLGVSVIPDSFFQKLRGLEVLNLSGCVDLTELPKSILDLVYLRALLLRGCSALHHIPCVSQLTSLRKLDAIGCLSLEEIEGLEMLVSLRYLHLSDTKIKSLPKETFRRLLKLQYLKVRAPIEEDITYLGALETLECCFGDANDFNKCVRVIGQGKIHRYYLTVNPFKSFGEREESDSDDYDEDPIFNLHKIIAIEKWSHAIVSVGGECTGNFILIPRDVQKLIMCYCHGITNLAGMGPLKCLEELIIEAEGNLRVLCGEDEEGIDIHDSPATIPSPPLFPSLRLLHIFRCPNLKHLFGYGSNFPLLHLREIHIIGCDEMTGIVATIASLSPCPNPAFPSLEEIIVCGCDKMKRVVESEWLPHFPNLREITVEDCKNMEEIIGGPPSNMTNGEIPLASLEVRRCHRMRMLFAHEWLIHLRNLQRIYVDDCEGMVEMISSGAGQSQDGSTRSEAGQSQGGSIMTPVSDTSSRSSISLPKLMHLQLWDLPQLQSICELSVTCDSIENIKVGRCPKLKGIPLRLRLRDIEDLPYIWVDDEETWNMLTWDHPDAQAILLPYLRKGEEATKRIEPWGTSGMSPTTIELPSKLKDLKWWFY